MIPAAFPTIAPAQTVGELFGPLAPIAAFGVVGALIILVALILADRRTAARRRPPEAAAAPSGPDKTPAAASVRPAA